MIGVKWCQMSTTIKCSQCGHQIEITEALKSELEAKVLAETQAQHREEIEKLTQERTELIKTKEAELEAAKKEIGETARKEAIEKVRREFEVKIQTTTEEAGEREKQNKELQGQVKDLIKQMRELKDAKGKLEMEYEKKLMEEEDKIRGKAKKEAEDEWRLKLADKDKQLADVMKAKEELSRKLEQGSQQLQGEVLELNFERLLKDNFPDDQIEPVEKGVRGADVRQTVRSRGGTVCGVILWETKRTKAWSDSWVEKLKQDLRAEKANIPVIVSTTLPKEVENGLGPKDGVWVTSFILAVPLAMLLRKNLLDLGYQKAVSIHRGKKADRLYEYIISHEFRQQVEAMAEVYLQMKGQITRERTAYEKLWKTRERQVDQLFSATANIVGSIQGEVGQTALPIKGLELLELGEGK
jgi:hypothetical protein